MPSGFDIDDELHQQLRAPVPPGVLAWVERERKCQVIAQRPLEGGRSTALHRLVLDGRGDVILQRFVLDWISDEPWAPANEALVIDLLAGTPVPAPEMIAADLEGQDTCAGPAQEDVAHCRVNLATHHGQAVADQLPPALD